MNNLVRIAAVTLFVLALVLAVVGLVSGQRQPRATSGPAPATPALVTHATVVAAKAVTAGHTLTADDLRLDPYPSRLEGSYDTPTALVGEVVGVALSPGAPVLKTFLSQSFALEVPAGERAIAVRVDETIGVANRIRPGDRVDVFVMLKQSGGEVGASSARLLMSRLQVLTYGDKQTAAAEANAPAERANRTETARTAVLAVPVDQVPALLLGESSGRLALALRHPDDPGTPKPDLWTNAPVLAVRNATTPEDRALAGARLDSLAGGAARAVSTPTRVAALAAPNARKSEQRSVEVVRSGKRENVTY